MAINVLVIGAGVAGKLLVRDIIEHEHALRVVGFVDDSAQEEQDWEVNVPILGTLDQIPELVRSLGVHQVIIAVPSERGTFVRRILDLLADTIDVDILILPRVSEVVFSAKVSYADVRIVELEDLVGEMIVKSDQLQAEPSFYQKNVLVTGGGGSIGLELSKQIFLLHPKKLIIVDCVEKNLFNCKNHIDDLKILSPDTEIHFVLGNINNIPMMKRIFKIHDIKIVFHAAAYKHVPIIEENTYEGAVNNILGTHTIAELAHANNCEKFILISTDKAVLPSSLMGKTKMVAEKIIEYFDSVSATIFTAVRFGNVFNSSGSAVELFLQQIEKRRPITITDPGMTRYFMTIPEAVHLVLQAASMAEKHKKYMLEMGEPINILSLAKCIVRIKRQQAASAEIKIVGARPGEKRHEVLYHSINEIRETTLHKRIFSIKNRQKSDIALFYSQLTEIFELLKLEVVVNHSEEGRQQLDNAVNQIV